MGTIKTKTTYLEMTSPTSLSVPSPRADLSVVAGTGLTVESYRDLYRQVGADYCWVDRIRMPDQELQAIIDDARVEIYVLQIEQEPIGYSELDRRTPGIIELAYLGLFPQAIGQGLGKYLLNWTVRRAWSYEPKRVWLHTCDLDHSAALPNYLKAGFQVYDEALVEQAIE